MDLNEELAEFIGAFIGDGCLSRYPRKNRPNDTTVIAFTGSWNNDSQYYKEVIKQIIKSNFDNLGYLYHRKKDDTVRYFIYNKEVISFLIMLGYGFGPKTNNVKIPKKILKNYKLSIPCIRGIFNTDGCIYRRYSKKYKNHSKEYLNYRVIQFKMNSKVLLDQIKEILNRLDIKSNKVIQDKNSFVLRITSQNDVKKFVKLINTKHKHHLERMYGPDGI